MTIRHVSWLRCHDYQTRLLTPLSWLSDTSPDFRCHDYQTRLLTSVVMTIRHVSWLPLSWLSDTSPDSVVMTIRHVSWLRCHDYQTPLLTSLLHLLQTDPAPAFNRRASYSDADSRGAPGWRNRTNVLLGCVDFTTSHLAWIVARSPIDSQGNVWML